MLLGLAGLLIASLLWPILRFLVAVAVVVWLAASVGDLVQAEPAKPYDYSFYKELTYKELYEFPANCELADKQLDILKRLQRAKNFDLDPDILSPADQDYNGRLKATIWWFAYRCEK